MTCFFNYAIVTSLVISIVLVDTVELSLHECHLLLSISTTVFKKFLLMESLQFSYFLRQFFFIIRMYLYNM